MLLLTWVAAADKREINGMPLRFELALETATSGTEHTGLRAAWPPESLSKLRAWGG
jgi:hypothetical protein